MGRRFKHLLTLKAGEDSGYWRYAFDGLLAILCALLITGIIFALQLYPRIPNISLLYLLIVLALASTRGLYSAILASLVAFFSFDYFLVPPLYTFTINKFDEWLALLVFLVSSIITGQLAAALSQRAEQAHIREHETRILYELVRAANSEEDLHRQLEIIARSIVNVFSSSGVIDCAILLPDARGKLVLQSSALQPESQVQLTPDEAATAEWVMSQAQAVELYDVSLAPQKTATSAPRAIVRSTTARSDMRRYIRLIPLKRGQKAIGIMRLQIEENFRLFALEKSLDGEQRGTDQRGAFFLAFLDQAATIIERARLHQESLQIEILRRTDELRAALLSSVSHDLRTPLSSIKASASSLLQEDVQWDDETRRGFALSIEQEADRLNRLVGNLLDMSRIEAGALKPQKELYPIGELIHDVLGRLQPLLQKRILRTNLPEDLPPVELDYLEIDQVISNLIENAVRYTPSESPIEIDARVVAHQLQVSVMDRGPGIPSADLERVFDKFYRVMETKSKMPSRAGSGLGLAVCKGLIEAHGGRIWANNREGGGAAFSFTLPLAQAEGRNL